MPALTRSHFHVEPGGFNTFQPSDPSLPYVGNGITFWPFENQKGGINVVFGIEHITKQIIDLFLTQPRECPYHTRRGIAPRLFDPSSDLPIEYWQFQLREQLALFTVDTCKGATVVISKPEWWENPVAEVVFVPRDQEAKNALTFDFHLYRGAVWKERPVAEFLTNLYLNGDRFLGFD